MSTAQPDVLRVLPDNPFVVESPERLSAEQIVALFIKEFTDIETVKQRRHTIIWGSRGSGKSMTLRYLEPQCQQLTVGSRETWLSSPSPFIGVYCPCKEGHFNQTEFESIDESVARVLSEHLLNITIAARVISCIRKQIGDDIFRSEELTAFVNNAVALFDASAISRSAGEADQKVSRTDAPLDWLQAVFAFESRQLSGFLRNSCLGSQPPAYLGATTGYHDFLLPYLMSVATLSRLNHATVFVLIDDADRLTKAQQSIVNSWIANRDHNNVCIKVTATREKYATLATTSGALIEQPHDYSEIDVEEIYTRSKSDYEQKITLICNKRLSLSKIPTKSIFDFLPFNANEAVLFEQIKQQTGQEWEAKPFGKKSDYVTRYASARLFQELKRKKRRKNYAGFQNLVHISSGVIRDFLEPCYLMVDAAVNSGTPVDAITSIRPSLQDEVIYQYSEDFLRTKLEDIRKDLPPEEWSKIASLRTLIESLGRLFYERLHDPESREARLFSFTIRGTVPPEIEAVLRLGLRYRYFQKGTYSSKEGGGREDWYILNRRLSPVFKLDPTGFEGRISLTPQFVQIACRDTAEFLRLRRKEEPSGDMPLFPPDGEQPEEPPHE